MRPLIIDQVRTGKTKPTYVVAVDAAEGAHGEQLHQEPQGLCGLGENDQHLMRGKQAIKGKNDREVRRERAARVGRVSKSKA